MNAFFPLATLTPQIYHDHWPKPVRDMMDLADDAQRYVQAKLLAEKGYQIDAECMIYKMEPAIIMGIRMNQDFTWIPHDPWGSQSYLPTMPGADLPGLPPYDPKNPPPGSIRVSYDAADYPLAPDLVKAPPPPMPTTVIGVSMGGPLYAAGPGAFDANNKFKYANGDSVTEGGHTYVAVVAQGLMGQANFFQLKA